MPRPCEEQNCTVVDTGQCLLNNDPETCPRRAPAEDAGQAPDIAAETAPIEPPRQEARFPLSLTLTPADARAMMAGRYCHLVGILGVPNSGKTAALVSLYLLLSSAKLDGFKFSDSRSLMAFNEISQGARHWNEQGEIPDELTVHTELADDRSAGFLHLQLRPSADAPLLDLLLPDLPGEWSTALMDESRVDRLAFFARADAVWIMLDGRQLADAATRRWTVHRTQLLVQRMAELVEPSTKVTLVVTHRDEVEPPAESLQAIVDEASAFGFTLAVRYIASFAKEGPMAPGTGIADLVADVRGAPAGTLPFWPETALPETRAMLRFRPPEART
jgi:hypothetical protein